MIVSQGKYVLQRKWAYMSRVSINYLRVKKVIEAFCTRKDKWKRPDIVVNRIFLERNIVSKYKESDDGNRICL